MYTHIDFDIAAAAVCLILLYYVSKKYESSLSTKCYKIMLGLTLLTAFMDTLGGLTMDYTCFSGHYVSLMYLPGVLNAIRLFLPVLTAMAYIRYVASFTGKKRKTRLERINIVLMIIYAAALVLSIRFGFIFSCNATEPAGSTANEAVACFTKGRLYPLTYLMPEILIISALILVLRYSRIFSKQQNMSVFYYAGFTLAGRFIETFLLPDTQITLFLASIAYMCMLFFLETPDFVKLSKTLAELKAANQAAQEAQKKALEAKEEAIAASAAKTRFLANMSHEIRTPINVIMGFDEMIIRDSGDAAAISYAESIKQAGTTLLELINEILDVSKIESGKMEIVPDSYSLSKLILELRSMTALKAESKGLEFLIEANPNIPETLFGDEMRIRQIILNLLSNAVKYTDKGRVVLRFDFKKAEKGIELLCEVEDTGRGLSKQALERIGNPYTRFDAKSNKKIEGTGLGLSITDRLLQLMGSSLSVKSEYGKGSTFSFSLLQGREGAEVIGRLEEREEDLASEEQKKNAGYLLVPDAEILAVDDTPINLKVIESLLTRTKASLVCATSGREAIEICRKRSFNLILLDHMMPQMDGAETLKHIRNDEAGLNRETPIVVLTADAVAGAREKYLDIGFDDYLSKPVSGIALEAMLEKQLPSQLCSRVSLEEGSLETLLEEEKTLLKEVGEIKGLITVHGIEAGGSVKMYLKVLEDVSDTYEMKVEKIEKLLAQENIKDFTIEVHALKSTARLMGADDLSRRAFELEELGKTGDLNNLVALTPGVLDVFKEIGSSLKGLFSKNSGRKQIDDVQLKDNLGALYEAVSHFDFDSADLIMNELKKYSFSPEFTEVFNKLKSYMAEVAHDEILEILEKEGVGSAMVREDKG